MKTNSVRAFECRNSNGTVHLLAFGHTPSPHEMAEHRSYYNQVFALGAYEGARFIGSPNYAPTLRQALDALQPDGQ